MGNKGGETALAERMERIRRIGLILFDIILHGKNSKVCRNIVRVAGAGIFWGGAGAVFLSGYSSYPYTLL